MCVDSISHQPLKRKVMKRLRRKQREVKEMSIIFGEIFWCTTVSVPRT